MITILLSTLLLHIIIARCFLQLIHLNVMVKFTTVAHQYSKSVECYYYDKYHHFIYNDVASLEKTRFGENIICNFFHDGFPHLINNN